MPQKQPPLTLEEIEAVEDTEDAAIADAVLAEMARTGEKGRPWEEVRAKLLAKYAE